MKRTQKYLILSLCFISQFAIAQTDTIALQKLKSFAKKINTFSKEYPQEKVYLHFDNTAYYLSETLWFKGYVVTAAGNALSPLSNTLYVELISPEGNILETKKLKIEDGQCHGDIKLPTSSSFAGFYEVRAYTRFMLNWDKEYLFSRVFPVYDKPVEEGLYRHIITERSPAQRVPNMRKEYEQKGNLAMSFFAEGGNLVAGLKSKVAFKATGKNGESVTVSGSVYNAKGTKVAELETGYLGMGLFEFTPNSGKNTAKVQYDNKEYTFDLPTYLAQGYVLNIDNSDEEKIDILIQKSALLKSESLGLSITCRGKLYGFEQVSIGEENAILLSFQKKLLPTGISQITLFNAAGEVLSERLTFVNHNSQMKISASMDKPSYLPFKPVNIDFELKDIRNNPIETSFSVAVHDAATTSANPYSDNILTNMLLSSEVKGYIENPGYYFESESPARKQALDLLLLTQGWSRYSWKQMTGNAPFVVKHPIEKSLVIEGSVLSLMLKKKVENVDLSIVLITDSASQRGTCLTDKDGKFNFALKDFKGNGKLILQSKIDDKRKEKNILLDRNFSPEIKNYAFAEISLTEYIKAVLDTVINTDTLGNVQADSKSKFTMDKKNHQLGEIVVQAKKKPTALPPVKVNIQYQVEKEIDKKRDLGTWLPADINIFLDNMSKYFTWEGDSNGGTSARYKGSKSVLFLRDDSPLLIGDINTINSDLGVGQSIDNSVGNVAVGLEGVSSEHIDEQRTVMPLLDEIESVSIVEDYASIMRIFPRVTDATKTVLVIMHLKKNYQKEVIGIRNTYFDGYAYVKEFFSPRYDRALLPDETDYRRTLYWNPDVKTGKDGKATISFYNNSSCKNMNVSAETVTEKGIIGVLNK